MEKIVVLLSTYNGEKYLREQLDSIINQSINAEIFIRDDGSSDTTLDIIDEYCDKHNFITCVKGENLGYVGSYFELMRTANEYDYYAFSDQDDIWFQDKLEVALNKLRALDLSKPCLYASCSLLVNDDMEGKLTTQFNRREINYYNIIIQNIMPGHTQVSNKLLIKEVLANRPSLDQIFVHDYWLALIAISFGDFYFDNEYHTYYRQHTGNSLGYGNGTFSWITERLKHVRDGAAKNITRQNTEFLKIYQDSLEEGQIKELTALLDSQKNIFKRIGYLFRAKVFRQKRSETLLFYVLYLIGGYKLK